MTGELEVTAWTVDDHTVQAIRHRELPMVAVQFHPESVMTQDGYRVFAPTGSPSAVSRAQWSAASACSPRSCADRRFVRGPRMRSDVGAGRVQCTRPRNLSVGDPTDQWPFLLPESPLLSLPLFELLSLGLGLGLSGAFVFTVTSEPFVDAFRRRSARTSPPWRHRSSCCRRRV